MKKIISMLLCIAMMVFALALVSCDDEEVHVHQYDRTKWASDKDAHWYAATCGCKDAGVVNRAAHTDPMNNGYCEVCGYMLCTDNPNGEYETAYTYDDFAHWHSPKCDCSGQNAHVMPDYEKHEDGKSTCGICGYTCDRVTYDDEYSYDSEYHWFASSCGHYDHDGLTLTKVKHVDNETVEGSDRVGDGVCDECGFAYCTVPEADTPEYNAFYNNTLVSDGTHHWYEPKCNHNHEFKGYEEHQDPELIEDPENEGEFIETELHDGYCDVCGTEIVTEDAPVEG